MASIESNIEDIRSAVYGREVRTAIADSIEQLNTTANNAVAAAENISGTITSMVDSNYAVVQETLTSLSGDIVNVSGQLAMETNRATQVENTKIDKPETDGTEGQVLTVQNDGSIAWSDAADPTNKIDKPETDGTEGQVLTVQNDGSLAWQDPPEFSTDRVAQAVSDWLDANPSATINLDDNCIATNMIVDNAVTEAKIYNGAITTNKIANEAINSNKLGTGCVQTDKIATSAVTTDKIANSAINSNKLGTGCVQTDKIATGAVISTKLADGATTTAKIADGNVTTAKIADNNITYSKISEDAKTKLSHNGTISPIYIGDFLTMTDYLPSSCLKIGDFLYEFDAHVGEVATDNTGNIRKFDIKSNIEVKSEISNAKFPKTTLNIGHANSVAFDPEANIVYIAPSHDYTLQGNARNTLVSYIYALSPNILSDGSYAFNNQPSIIRTPTGTNMVSFDPIQKVLYANMQSGTTGVKAIYKYNGNESWTLYTKLDLRRFKNLKYDPNDTNYPYSLFNQDLAVYNGMYYVSNPDGVIAYGELKNTGSSGYSPVYGVLTVNKIDSDGRFRYGELEGMEFDGEGHLYATAFLTIDAWDTTSSSATYTKKGLRNGIIFEIPVGMTIQHRSTTGFNYKGLVDNTITLSKDTQNAFYLAMHQIRSLNQLSKSIITTFTSSTVKIPAVTGTSNDYIVDESNYDVQIIQDIELELHGLLKVDKLNIFKGTLFINPSNDSGYTNHALIITSNYVIGASRSAQIKFGSSKSLRIYPSGVSGNIELIASAASENTVSVLPVLPYIAKNLTSTTVDSSRYITLGGTQLTEIGMRFGKTLLSTPYYNVGDIITIATSTLFIGHITDGRKTCRFTIPLPKQLPSGCTISITTGAIIGRCANGEYLDGRSASSSTPDPMDIRTNTSSFINSVCTVTCTGTNNFINISVTKSSVFDGDPLNNSPVSVATSGDLVIKIS